MTCETLTMPNGTVAIVCNGRRHTRKPCAHCGGASSKLCDYPVRAELRRSRTCDKPLCERCAVKGGDDIDYCPTHTVLRTGEQLGLSL